MSLKQGLVLLLYVGPDQVMPLLSIIGAAIGVILMWWRRLVMLTRRIFRPHSPKKESPTKLVR